MDEHTIKYGDENVIVSHEKYDRLIQDYRREIAHAAFLWNKKEEMQEMQKNI